MSWLGICAGSIYHVHLRGTCGTVNYHPALKNQKAFPWEKSDQNHVDKRILGGKGLRYEDSTNIIFVRPVYILYIMSDVIWRMFQVCTYTAHGFYERSVMMQRLFHHKYSMVLLSTRWLEFLLHNTWDDDPKHKENWPWHILRAVSPKPCLVGAQPSNCCNPLLVIYWKMIIHWSSTAHH